MSYNGSGTFLINSAGQPVVANTVISATVFNALTSDLATGLSTAITKDGQTTITNNIPFGSNKITGLGSGTAAADAANLGQVQSTVAKLITVTGTDTITGSMSPQLTAYAAGQLFYFVANAANTGAVTLNIDSLGAKSITRDGSSALAAGDINSGEVVVVIYDGTRFQMINAANSFGNTTINGTLTVTGNAGFQANVSITSALSVGGVFAVTGAATFTANPTLSGGTANGVLYLNGSKVATSGSALTFDGSTFATTVASNFATSNGNVGIGTSSPNQKLSVASAACLVDITSTTGTNFNGIEFKNTSGSFYIGEDNSAGSFYGSNSAYARSLYATGAYPMVFFTNATERMRLDSSGNLGLGVTPSAWSGYKALQIGAGTSLAGWTSDGGTELTSNAFFNGSNWIYIATAAATRYQITSTGENRWYRAASGTAGNTITFTQAMTLDASGNLLVGTTSSTLGRLEVVGGAGIRVNEDAAGTKVIQVRSAFAGGDPAINVSTNHALAFNTNNTERGRFTAGGFFKASNTGTYASSTDDRHELRSDKNDINVLVGTTSTGSSVVNVYSSFPASPNAGAYHFAAAISGSGYQFTVDADGDVKNTNGSYAAISDLKLKQDIEDAASQWDDIKSVRVRKYRFKRTPDAPLQIGVIAQELEQTSPGLVSEDADRDDENNELGTTTKSVKYSILYMKAIKALQEAMARIEQLEVKVAALESK